MLFFIRVYSGNDTLSGRLRAGRGHVWRIVLQGSTGVVGNCYGIIAYAYAAELFRTIFHSFEAGIANANSSSK